MLAGSGAGVPNPPQESPTRFSLTGPTRYEEVQVRRYLSSSRVSCVRSGHATWWFPSSSPEASFLNILPSGGLTFSNPFSCRDQPSNFVGVQGGRDGRDQRSPSASRDQE